MDERNLPERYDDIRTAIEIGRIVAQSGYFAAIANVPQAVAKILRGRELGIPPMTAVENVYIVNGRTALHAGLIGALIKQSGRYSYKVVEQTDQRCVLKFFESGTEVGESTYTFDEAQRAGLVKPGSPWEKYPSDMLFARALTRGARRFCPDVFQGSIYTPEELTAGTSVDEPVVIDAELSPAPDEPAGDGTSEPGEPDPEATTAVPEGVELELELGELSGIGSGRAQLIDKIKRGWEWLNSYGVYTSIQHRWNSIDRVCDASRKYSITEGTPAERISTFFRSAELSDLMAYMKHLKKKHDDIKKGGDTNEAKGDSK